MKRKLLAGRLAACVLITAILMMTGTACGKKTDTDDQEDEEVEVTESTMPDELLSDYLMGMNFRGDAYNIVDNQYEDVTKIDLGISFYSGAGERTWHYNYVATIDDQEIAREENVELSESTEISVNIFDDNRFFEGHLVIAVTDEYGNEIVTAECDILRTPDPTIADVSDFRITDHDTYHFPGTDLDITVDDRFEVLDPSQTVEIGEEGEEPDITYEYEVLTEVGDFYSDEYEANFSIQYVGQYDCQSRYVQNSSLTVMEGMSQVFDQGGVENEIRWFNVDLGGQDTTVYYMTIWYEDKVVVVYAFHFGDEDTTYTANGEFRFPTDQDVDIEAEITEITDMITRSEYETPA